VKKISRNCCGIQF